MGLSSSDSGGGKTDNASAAKANPGHSFGDTLMGMIKQRYPIAGAVGNAVGIGGPSGGAPGMNYAPTTSGGPIPLPEINMSQGGQQAPIDQTMLQAGQIGSQHSKLFEMIKSMVAGGG